MLVNILLRMMRLKQENNFRWLDIELNFFWKLHLTASPPDHIRKPRCKQSIIHLRYSRGIGQVQVRYFECKIQAKRTLKWAWQDRYICSLVDSSHLVLSLVSTDDIKCLPRPFCREGLADLCDSSQG